MKSLNFADLLALLAVLALSGCSRESEVVSAPEPDAPKVDAAQGTVRFPTNAPQLSSIVAQATEPRAFAVSHVTGRLYWDDDVTTRIFTPVAGRVIGVQAELGQSVTNGMPLAEIDSPDFAQALANARTAIGNAAAAERAYTRSKELLQHGAAAQKDVEATEAANVAARAEHDRAEAVLANYGGSDQSSNAVYLLRSPIAGMLVEKNITPGQELRADLMLANAPNLFAPLFVVTDPAKLWLQIDVAELDLSALQPGDPLQISSPAFPGKIFKGTVDNLGATMDPATRTIKARGMVENPDNLLKAEMYVTVAVAQKSGSTASLGVDVPSKALFMIGNDSYLFVETAPGNFQRVLVKVGIEQDNQVPILEGVAAGQKVVTEGALLLQALVDPAS